MQSKSKMMKISYHKYPLDDNCIFMYDNFRTSLIFSVILQA